MLGYRHRDGAPGRRPRRTDAGPALLGASFAVLAALAGVFAHGLADPEAMRHAPGPDALVLLTALVLGLGALSGIAADAVRRALPGGRGAGGGAGARAAAALGALAGPRGLGLLGPVLAGQWLAHAVLHADHEISAALSGAPAGGSAAAALAAASAGGHAAHARHAATEGLSALAAGGGHASGMVLPMLVAHALGVLACLLVCALADRALRGLVGAFLRPLPPLAAARRAPRALRWRVVGHGRAGLACAGPRAPPLLLAA